MTTTPNPKTVREIVEDAIHEGARAASIEDVLRGHPCLDDGDADYDEWFDAIAAQMPVPVVTVSWPDKPQCGRPAADLAHAAEDVRRHLALRARAVNDEVLNNPDVLAVVRTGGESHALMESVLRTLLAERDALAACVDGRLRARLREEIERRSYAVTHAKVCEEKCDKALDELEQLRATVAARPLDPARKHCLLCGHYFLAHRNDVGCMHCQCTAGVAAPVPRPATAQQLHARFAHPGFEYAITQGQRKAWDDINVPPEGDGWERNVDAGRPGEGWDRFDYHEESYWRRRRPEAPHQPAPEGSD